ncbi:MAG: 1-phosphofructokinase family hexose kinase [Bacillus sp. (in: firmicutes)]
MIYTVTLNAAVDKILYFSEPLQAKKNNRVSHYTYDYGGKGTHVSSVITKMNIHQVALGIIGGDTGEKLKQLLHDEHINYAFTEQPGARTRETLVLVDNDGKGSVMITEGGFTVERAVVDKLLNTLNVITSHDIVVFAGNPPQDFPLEWYGELLSLVKKKGAQLVVDASGDYLNEAILHEPTMIKPNEFEFAQWMNQSNMTEQEIEDALPELAKRYNIPYLIVSLGKQGSMVFHDGKIIRVTPPAVKEKNDTGCGDAFVGGLVTKLSEGKPIEDILRFATAISASKAAQETSSYIDFEYAHELEQQVKITTKILEEAI